MPRPSRATMPFVAIFWALAGCPRPAPPEAAAPPAAPVAVAPRVTPPPTDPLTLGVAGMPPGAPALPPLSGSVQSLDLQKLATSTTRFRIEADVAMFGATTPELAEALLTGMARDPRWRVGRWEGQTVAWERQRSGKIWEVPLGGYHQRSATGPTWRGQLRFEPRPAEHPWSASSLVGHNAPEDKVLTVAGWRVTGSDWDGQQAAALAIDGPGVSLEIHEIARELGLQETARLLRSLTVRVAGVVELGSRGDLPASRTAFQPTGEPALVPQSLTLRTTEQTVTVHGRLNPGEPGWTFLRILDADGQPWDDARISTLSAERIGHDSSPDVAFWYQCTLPRAATLPVEGTLEAWFRPDDGDGGAAPLRMLLKLPLDRRSTAAVSPSETEQ